MKQNSDATVNLPLRVRICEESLDDPPLRSVGYGLSDQELLSGPEFN